MNNKNTLPPPMPEPVWDQFSALLKESGHPHMLVAQVASEGGQRSIRVAAMNITLDRASYMIGVAICHTASSSGLSIPEVGHFATQYAVEAFGLQIEKAANPEGDNNEQDI